MSTEVWCLHHYRCAKINKHNQQQTNLH